MAEPVETRILVGKTPTKGARAKHAVVKEWLENRPLTTQEQYCRKLINFCEATGVTPEGFLELSRFEARDKVWKFVRPFIRESTTKAKNHLAALKSFYRSKDGEILRARK